MWLVYVRRGLTCYTSGDQCVRVGKEQQNHQHQPFRGNFILKFAKFIIEIKLA